MRDHSNTATPITLRIEHTALSPCRAQYQPETPNPRANISRALINMGNNLQKDVSSCLLLY